MTKDEMKELETAGFNLGVLLGFVVFLSVMAVMVMGWQ